MWLAISIVFGIFALYLGVFLGVEVERNQRSDKFMFGLLVFVVLSAGASIWAAKMSGSNRPVGELATESALETDATYRTMACEGNPHNGVFAVFRNEGDWKMVAVRFSPPASDCRGIPYRFRVIRQNVAMSFVEQ